MRNKRNIGWALGVMLLLVGCATAPSPRQPAAGTDRGDAAVPGPQEWMRSELYFGVGGEDGADAIDETRWRAFLDTQVTPRFPDGLTVFEAYGQWRFRDAPAPARLRTKVLVILHEDSAQRIADLEAIRLAWKRETGHESVLWVRQAAEVSF